MIHLSQLTLFVAGTAIIVAIPGPNILYLVARSVHQGRRAGVVSVLGIEAATLVHIGAATAGLTSLLLASALAFSVVKYLGAAYLVYLGVLKLRSREEAGPTPLAPERELKRVFGQAFIVNLLNPKTSLFFLAFLPQFVDARGGAPIQILSWGLLLVLVASGIELAYVLVASKLRSWLKGDERAARRRRYLAGGTYIALGVATAFTGRKAG